MSLQLKLHISAIGALTGTTRTLQEWGVIGATLKLQAGGEDELQLEFARNYNEAAVFPDWATVQLFDERNIRRFYGIALRPRQTHEAERRRHTVRVLGPHFWLRRSTFVQPWMFATEVSEEAPQALSDVSDLILYRRGEDNTAVPLKSQVEAILQHALAEGAPITWSFDNFPDLRLPEQKDRLAADWELFTKQLSFLPHVTALWDYAIHPLLGGQPVLRFARSDAGRIRGPWTVRAVYPEHLAGEEIVPRDDLLVRQVKVCFVKRQNQLVAGEPKILRTIQTQTSTANPADDGFNAFGSIVVTVNLRAPVSDGEEQTIPPENVPDENLAAALHESFLHLWHEFQFDVPSQAVDWSWAIGQEVHVFGHSADVNAARAMVVGLTYDLAKARTVVQCGPPGRLIHAAVGELLRPWRTANWGFEESDNPGDGKEPKGGGDSFPTKRIVYATAGGFATGDFHVRDVVS